MRSFMDGLLTAILLVLTVLAVLVLLAAMAVWWAVAIVASLVLGLAELICTGRLRRLLASDE